MYYWVQILFNQWYITLLSHDIIWVCCEVNKLRKVYYVIPRYQYHVQRIYVYGIRLDRLLKDIIDTIKISSKVVILGSFPNILIYTHDWKITLTHVNNKTGFQFSRQFCFSLLSKPYISNISNLKNPDKNLSLWFQTMCDHIKIYMFLAMYLAYIYFLFLWGKCPLTSNMRRCWNLL